ncbi:Fatty acyl-CoA hydrolase precursor, medium chain [Frankliniella fusca]|uniref:Fatty acyl-CoA hydrolase, medium chain n=1 Tax=Frankliniella fusca TaxID=407009 RepID=A0AAE1H2C1_9NEOP|nr:Fatty acyl-CoA hydrolase precursor, medium chain [Frankliniella fusca]
MTIHRQLTAHMSANERCLLAGNRSCGGPHLVLYIERAPRKPATWEGIRDATKTGDKCSQMSLRGSVEGSEDCLYLNVYTPALPAQDQGVKNKLLPVYFFVHGGKFQSGSASPEQFGPDRFIEEEIVVVTIQYRVNSYGFVSLDSEELPGNCAVKDAIAALQWVNENIKNFGGDPNAVTVGGQSAGSALAGWLTILPETKGIMHQAILESGSAYHNWAYGEDHVEMTLDLASRVAKRKVTDKSEAEKVLMEAETESLTKATFELIAEKMKTQPELPYKPTPERRPAIPGGEPSLITHDAESYFLNPPSPHVPQILGITNEEWRFYYYGANPKSDPKIDEELLENLHLHVPKDLIPNADTRKILGLPADINVDYNTVIAKVQAAIRKEVSQSCSLGCVLKKYFDGIWMHTDTHRLGAYLASRNETVYLYRFGVRTSLNRPFAINPVPDDELNAAQHGDDMNYLWLRAQNKGALDELESLTTRRMVSMWSSFIKNGKPIVRTDDLLPVKWTPNKETNLEVTFLDIGKDLKLRKEPMATMLPFWYGLYEEYRTPPNPQVTVAQGMLRGMRKMAATGSNRSYFAFLGIPYAQPPTGKLRYKAPKKPATWEGIRDATKESSKCSQMSRSGDAIEGSEDCLYLNVYTPALPAQNQDTAKKLLPVYFFVHGGKFQYGGASPEEYGPDRFVEQDVVVVTIQYRVNSYGFVSLDSEELPGNCAIKDAIAALQWVNENIKNFGGDPNAVTVGGQSAGSALAGWLTILPETKGIMHQAILESGTAYHNWAYGEDHVEMTLDLASRVAKRKVTDKSEAEKVLMEAETDSLTKATFELVAEKMKTQPELPYRPTPERRPAKPGGEPLLITHDAESYFLNPPSPHVPQILGITNEEWRFYYYGANPKSDPKIDEELLENLHLHVPKDLIPNADTRKILGLPADINVDYNTVIAKVQAAIRKEVSQSCSLGCVLKKYFDGIWMNTDTHRLGAYLAARGETVYLYRFGVRTSLNRPFAITPVPDDEQNAAQHGDDLGYLWFGEGDENLVLNELESVTVKRMIAIKPIAARDNNLLPVDWTPNKETGQEVTFLDIEKDLTLRKESMATMLPFWYALYEEYRTPPTPQVTVAQGMLRGIKKTAATGSNRSYFAFLGIPYAQPPTGKLRFKAPKKPATWEGVRDATKASDKCSQVSPRGVVEGSEDCLYLNVYTPALPAQAPDTTNKLLPVYFFVHGGKFQGGSASPDEFGPDRFVEQDIVVVTIQYRVNSYGFVSLDSEEMPGNCAVKDAIAALQWVNENIKNFGGDPNAVTVGGQSAGSALVGWLTILPETKGIMHQAILESGSAYHNWAYGEDHVEMTLDLASRVAKRKVTDKSEAEKVLMEAETENLSKATFELIDEKMKTQPELPYRPTPERRPVIQGGEPLLITRDAESYFLNPPSPHVPQILGVTNEEWRFYYYGANPKSDPKIDEELLENLHLHVPKDLIPNADTRKILGLPADINVDYNTVIAKVQAAIRKEVSQSCSLGCVLKKYFDGIWMHTDTHRLGAYLAARGETVYLYRFGVRTSLNRPFAITPVPDDEKNAAQHSDDLMYLWFRPQNKDVVLDELESLTTRRMVAMWTSFIKNGKPIVSRNDLLPVDWTPNKGTDLKVTFLDIEKDLTLREESMAPMLPFWYGLYKEYRTPMTSKRN